MKYDEKLIELIKEKKFKTFWHCLDYLLLAGYNQIDCFAVSLKEFEDTDIFSCVAFARIDTHHNTYLNAITGHYGDNTNRLMIGIIDDRNIHLDGIYKQYRDWLKNEHWGPQLEIESACEVVTISGLMDFFLIYINNESSKHFGYEILAPIKIGSRAPTAPPQQMPPTMPHPEINTDDYRRMIEDYVQRSTRDDERIRRMMHNG